MRPRRCLAAWLLLGLACGVPAEAGGYVEVPSLQAQVESGALPPVSERLPQLPALARFVGEGRGMGQHGGELRTLIGRAKDVRMLVVYGYARLVAYDESFDLVPDILADFESHEDRAFTLRLRPGHRWSDGQPFTAEDIRYWWEDVANNKELSPAGPPPEMLVAGKPPQFELLDATTVRFTWPAPNASFLPRQASASPLFIYRPAHYLKQFHARFAEPDRLARAVKERRVRNWAALHNRLDNLYDFDNPDLPTLQPWSNRTAPPATRFVAERNPFYHRVDEAGRQLPYLDRVIMNVADAKLIPAKTGAGETDLQARGLAFNNYTFLRDNEERSGFRTHLWRTAKGAHVALFPNLNVNDPVWRQLIRDVRFRRALSLAVDRPIINRSLYFGLALAGNNTVLPGSQLFKPDYQTRWAGFDPDAANRLLDELGLRKRNREGARLLPDGRPLEIVIETAGEDTEQTDVLELVRESWSEIGVKVFAKPTQREVFRNRVFSGATVMAVWSGYENGLCTPDMNPQELAPTSQQQLQWPKWGQYAESGGKQGEAPDLPEAIRLAELATAWLAAGSVAERRRIWHEMLEIHADQAFSIGIVSGVKQPVAARTNLRNLPEEGVYNWDPGAHFGLYRPDTFWLDGRG